MQSMVSYLKNQSLNLTSELSDNQKPSLEESFESYIKARYGYDTKLGRCLFTLLALIHLKCPSSYLASQSVEALDDYRSTAPDFRVALLDLQTHVRRGNSAVVNGEECQCRLPDGTSIFIKLTKHEAEGVDAQEHFLVDETDSRSEYVSIKIGESGTWIDSGTSLESLIKKIEGDVIENPDHFDPKLVASCKLSSACQTVDKISLNGIIDPQTQRPKIDVNSGQPMYMEPDELNRRLLDPDSDPDVRAIHDDLEHIAQNLALCGFYDDALDPSLTGEIALTPRLYMVLKLFISKNIGAILKGDSNFNSFRALDLIDTIPQKNLFSHFRTIKICIDFVQDFTGLSLRAAVNSRAGNLVEQCVSARKTNPSDKTRYDFFILEELVGRLPAEDPEFDEFRTLISGCNDHISQTELADDEDIDRLEFEE